MNSPSLLLVVSSIEESEQILVSESLGEIQGWSKERRSREEKEERERRKRGKEGEEKNSPSLLLVVSSIEESEQILVSESLGEIQGWSKERRSREDEEEREEKEREGRRREE
jgi:hypothetical protein